ncbi:MAG: putative multidrug export ATP-binding/permease protein [Bryobacterales bacterium]|nr:putative multidrug export ATP-binding/permease protein [Bryobacterales bacterium]
MVWDANPALTSLSIVLRIVAALMPLSMLAVSKMIIDRVVAVVAYHTPVPPEIWWLLALEFVLAAAGNVLGRLIDYCDALMADYFTKRISVKIIEHATELDLASFEDPVFADKLERARVQSTDRLGMLSGIGRMGQQAITLISLAAGVFYFSPWLLLLLFVCTVPAFLGESHFAFLGYSLAHRLTPDRRQLDYLRVLGASKEGAKEVKIFGLGRYISDRYREIADRVFEQNRSLVTRRAWAGGFLAIIGSFGYYGAYVLAVYRTLKGELSVGDLTFLAGAIAGTSTNIQALFSTFSSIADQALFLTDLLEFFDTRPVIRSPDRPILFPRPIQKGFEFRKVCFKYPGSSRMVLRELDFRLEPGSRVALIGENGQGKTTFVKLLARLYDPTAGKILLDGNDLRDYSIEELGHEIGVIFQDFMRYELTARENIGVGRIEDLLNSDRLALAARKSLADEVIEKLPRGMNQLLGRRFEGGVDLSGGEWQKFALARAYLRDAQLLILDEPTASLDAKSEYEVFRRFSELTEGRMALLISHRFSTVRMADRILVLEDGAIRERGTHDELVSLGGRYAEMFELQAAGYR